MGIMDQLKKIAKTFSGLEPEDRMLNDEFNFDKKFSQNTKPNKIDEDKEFVLVDKEDISENYEVIEASTYHQDSLNKKSKSPTTTTPSNNINF